MTFKVSSYGKWILAGEHSVLRGSPAIAFPVFSRRLNLRYLENDSPLTIDVSGEQAPLLHQFADVLIQRSQETIKKMQLRGHLILDNSIPIGTGLGASAALAVNLSKWFQHLGFISEKKVFSFARDLETIAHGKSSGLDIATIISNQGIFFHKGKKDWNLCNTTWKPRLFLAYSGSQGLTANCVRQVEQFIKKNKKTAPSIDERMKKAALLGQEALGQDETKGFDLLKESIELANSCFSDWNLITEEMQKKVMWMQEQGAVAIKPVGSGGGGYLLGLWKDSPSDEAMNELIPCFE